MDNNTNYNIRHWENNFGKPHSHWKYIALGDLFVEQISTAVNDGTYILCSLTIEEGVVEKSDRYNREFLLKDQESNKYKCVQLEDIVINPMNLRFGAVAKSEHKNTVLVSGYYNVIKHSDLADSNYLISLLQSSAMGYMYERIALGSLNEKKRVHLSALKNVLIPVPSVKEQRKIGEILSTWDKAISTTERLIDNSKQQKKALMQQLLTGKKRLLDDSGKPFEGEWEEVKLSDVFTLSSGDTKPKDVEKEQTNTQCFPVFGGNNIMGYSAKSNSTGNVILIGRVGEYCGVTRLVQNDCWITDNALFTKKFSADFDKQFIVYLLQKFDLSRLRNKGGQPLISQKPIYGVKIEIPSLREQQKVASVLLNADREIDLLQQQLSDLRQEKKALMQQLLTGKRRVKT